MSTSPHPSERTNRTAMLALLLVGAALWGVNAWITLAAPGRALLSFDSAEYALAARELATTGKLATPYSYVGALDEARRPPYPLLAGHPLLPMLEAPVFKLFGAHAVGTLVPVAVAYLVTLALAAQLALAAGASPAVALVAGLALAATPSMLANATDGLSEMPFTAAWTGALLVLAMSRRRARPFVLGALLGLAHLARPVVVPTLPVWLIACAWAAAPRTRIRTVALVLAGFVPCALALLVYKWRATGSAFTDVGGIMLLTDLAPQFQPQDVARLLHPPNAMAWLQAHPDALVAKLRHSVPEMVSQALRLGGWPAGIAFAVWVLRPRLDEGSLRLVAGLGLATMAGHAALTLPRSHYLFPMLPAVIAFGAVELERGGRALRLPTGLPLALVAGLLSWSSMRPLAAEWASMRSGPRATAAFGERDLVRMGAELAARIPAGTIVCSDMGPWVSWYSGLPSVNVPFATSDLAELRARHGIGAVVLTNEWLITLPGNEAWRAAHDGTLPPAGWVAGESIVAGGLEARLLWPADQPSAATAQSDSATAPPSSGPRTASEKRSGLK